MQETRLSKMTEESAEILFQNRYFHLFSKMYNLERRSCFSSSRTKFRIRTKRSVWRRNWTPNSRKSKRNKWWMRRSSCLRHGRHLPTRVCSTTARLITPCSIPALASSRAINCTIRPKKNSNWSNKSSQIKGRFPCKGTPKTG